MGKSIIPAKTAIETFRDSGYKNTASAIAELIDNSIEAKAQNIQILTFEEQVMRRKRTQSAIKEIAVYDDGDGMPPEVLAICLQFGNGTRLKSRSGIGRFGIGLPNASVSQCRRIEVFSWQDGTCYSTFLDIDEVKEKDLEKVNEVVQCEMPTQYLNEIEGNSKDHGTLIIWKKCDRLDMKRSRTLYTTMSNDLCRIYRHFLDDDDRYGIKRDIKLIATGKERTIYVLKANDPLYRMTPNNVPGYENQATNEAIDKVRLELPYDEDGNKGVVEMRFSMAKPEIQKLGGGSKLGKHYARNVGISFVRAAREIDFDDFGFFNSQDERQRWWGCEIRFEPEFDELFGVTNNKQSVRGIHYLDLKQFKRDYDEEDVEELLETDLKLNLRAELSRVFKAQHKKMWDVITKRGANTRSGDDDESVSKSEKVFNTALSGATTKTSSSQKGANLSKNEKEREWEKRAAQKDPTLTDEEVKKVAQEKSKLKIAKDFSSWPGNAFITVEPVGETCVCVINTKHPFYTELYEPLASKDESLVNELDILLMTYARAQDEMYDYQDEIEEHREKWGEHLKKVLKKLKEDA